MIAFTAYRVGPAMGKVPKTDHRANQILAALAPADFALLEPSLEHVALSKGEVLYETGETVRFAYFPHDAMISLLTVMAEGGSVEMAVFGREAVVGFSSTLMTRESFGRYVVQLAGTASRVSVDHLHEIFMKRPAVHRLLLGFTEALLHQTFQTAACNAIHTVEARCCRWILSTQDRTGGETLPLTHEFLAEMLGVQRPTISLVTRALQTAGLIRQGRGTIVVLDRAGLEKVTCECYFTIRRIFERHLPVTVSGLHKKSQARS